MRGTENWVSRRMRSPGWGVSVDASPPGSRPKPEGL